jgi:hypothetical protein
MATLKLYCERLRKLLFLFVAWAVLMAGPAAAEEKLRVPASISFAAEASQYVGVDRSTVLLARQPDGKQQKWRISLPYKGELTLDAPGVWEFSTAVIGYWSKPFRLLRGEIGPVELKLFPTGKIRAVALVPDDEIPPENLTLTVQASTAQGPKELTAQELIPRSDFECVKGPTSWECEVPAGNLDLRFAIEGFAPRYLWSVRLSPGGVLDLGPISFEKGASVAGWIATEDHAADLEDAKVTVEPQESSFNPDPGARERAKLRQISAVVDEQGFFQITDLVPGAYRLTVSKTGYARTKILSLAVQELRELLLEEPVVLRRLLEIEAYIDPALDLLDQPWSVKLGQQKGVTNVYTTIGEGQASYDGYWHKAELEPGNYYIEIRDSEESTWLKQKIELSSTIAPLFLPIELIPIRGVVTIGDDPLTTTIVFGTTKRKPSIKIQSDDQGRFEGLLPHEGLWPVEVIHGEGVLSQALDPIEIRRRSGKTYAEVEIALPGTRLAGRVVKDTQPAPGASVLVLRDQDGRLRREGVAQADDEGSFEFRGMLPGTLQVQAYRRSESSESVLVTLHEDAMDSEVLLELKRKSELTGRVVSPHGGVSGAQLVAMPVGASFQLPASAITRSDGFFSLQLPEDTEVIDLLVIPAGFDVVMRRHLVRLRSNDSLVVHLDGLGGDLLIDADLKTATLRHQGAEVPLSSLFIPLNRLGRIDLTGRDGVVFRGFAPGSYSLCRAAGLGGDDCATGELHSQSQLPLMVGEE